MVDPVIIHVYSITFGGCHEKKNSRFSFASTSKRPRHVILVRLANPAKLDHFNRDWGENKK